MRPRQIEGGNYLALPSSSVQADEFVQDVVATAAPWPGASFSHCRLHGGSSHHGLRTRPVSSHPPALPARCPRAGKLPKAKSLIIPEGCSSRHVPPDGLALIFPALWPGSKHWPGSLLLADAHAQLKLDSQFHEPRPKNLATSRNNSGPRHAFIDVAIPRAVKKKGGNYSVKIPH